MNKHWYRKMHAEVFNSSSRISMSLFRQSLTMRQLGNVWIDYVKYEYQTKTLGSGSFNNVDVSVSSYNSFQWQAEELFFISLVLELGRVPFFVRTRTHLPGSYHNNMICMIKLAMRSRYFKRKKISWYNIIRLSTINRIQLYGSTQLQCEISWEVNLL